MSGRCLTIDMSHTKLSTVPRAPLLFLLTVLFPWMLDPALSHPGQLSYSQYGHVSCFQTLHPMYQRYFQNIVLIHPVTSRHLYCSYLALSHQHLLLGFLQWDPTDLPASVLAPPLWPLLSRQTDGQIMAFPAQIFQCFPKSLRIKWEPFPVAFKIFRDPPSHLPDFISCHSHLHTDLLAVS